MSNDFPTVDGQLFVEMNGGIDFLVVVRVADNLLREEQVKAIYERALALPIAYAKNRIGLVIVQNEGITYRDATSYAEGA